MTSPARPQFRPDIEGLRGIAILLVVLFHAGVGLFRGAFVAVDVFFVLSGFFLTTALVREIATEGRTDLTAFYARRMLRLLPVFLLVLVATLASAMLLYAPIDRPRVADDMQSVVFFAGNLAFASGGVNYFSEGENPLLHTWSLGVEQQFHLLWPLLLLLFAWLATRRLVQGASISEERRQAIVRGMLLGIVVAGAVSFALSVWLSSATPMWAYFGPHTRLWQFAAGGAIAMLAGAHGMFGENRRAVTVAQAVGLAAIAFAALWFDRRMTYPGAAALLPVMGAVLILGVGSFGATTAIGRALSIPPLQWLGRVSYAWYLWHWPVMVLGGMLNPDISTAGRLLCGLIALGLSVLTERLIETPLRRGVLATRPSQPVFFGATIASTVVLLMALVASAKANRDVSTGAQRAFMLAREDRMSHKCWVRSVDALPNGSCAFGDRKSNTTIMLLGDSHAEHWLGGLDRAGREHGWKIVANVMGGCPVADFSGRTSGAASRYFAECERYREAMLQRIIRERPAAVILSSYDHYVAERESERRDYHIGGDVWAEGLERTYHRLDDAGIRTIVIRGTPRTWFDVPACLSRRAAQLPFSRDCTYERNIRFMHAAQHAQDVAARGRPISFIDMNDQICTGTRCPTVKNGIVMFTDDNHLTASFTRSLAPVLGRRLQEALSANVLAERGVELRGLTATNSQQPEYSQTNAGNANKR